MRTSGTAVADRRPTSDLILDAARRRYERFGPRKTTMEEVAREAGCSRATLYSHFPSKRDLYAGLLEAETVGFLEEVDAAVESNVSADDKLRSIFEATVRIYTGSPVLHAALAGDEEMSLERVAAPVLRAHQQHVVERLRAVLEEGITAGDFRGLDTQAVAYLMYELGHALVTREFSGIAELSFERVMRAMDDVLGNGIQRSPSP